MTDLKEEIRNHIKAKGSLQDMWLVLKKHRDEGISKEETLTILGDLRKEFVGENEDRILELMDFVVGFCSPFMKLW